MLPVGVDCSLQWFFLGFSINYHINISENLELSINHHFTTHISSQYKDSVLSCRSCFLFYCIKSTCFDPEIGSSCLLETVGQHSLILCRTLSCSVSLSASSTISHLLHRNKAHCGLKKLFFSSQVCRTISISFNTYSETLHRYGFVFGFWMY